MKISRISYSSAVFFGVFALVISFLYGLLEWAARDIISQTYGIEVTAVSSLVLTPIVGGLIGYLVILAAIVIYNIVAMKFAIGWEIKK